MFSACMSLVLSNSPAHSTSKDQPYDWTVDIKTQQLQRQFDYPGTKLTPVVKTELQYYPMDAQSNKTKYEHIWYCKGKALGLERLHKFQITEGDGIAIKISHKTDDPTSGEYKAAANAILRILIDAYLNKNALVTVKIPPNSFSPISNELRSNPHIDTSGGGSETPVSSGVPIFLQTDEPDGPTLQLYYFQS
jgi:hypothetical protein